ncbi:serine/threonine protein kinase [Rhodopirellula islandica]|uniref:Serine/threonine protein kinase n=1 Tax=Rhodopirellula islandica TaxID=595434 RepID=A0A0J1BDE7_RHOIS|nr:serine/threonine-protein kinase [Rhodopirellula islandica]KLU04643.1 serine/threonine protein kinase [Rhodopirellula islandica]
MNSPNDAPTEAARSEDDQAGTPTQHFGNYQIIRTLGSGGMGEVYLAEDITTGQNVALKLLQHQVSKQVRMRRRFEREANLIQELRHEHIVPLMDSGVERGMQYLVMRYIDGPTLADRILKATGEHESQEFSMDSTHECETADTECDRAGTATASFELIAESIADIADALQVAHNERVIHRDIKPSNLLFDREGKIWLTDFGLALIEDQNTALTLSGAILGTPAYMSPEQTFGSQTDITRRSDIYSLGATLYEWATLRRPFQGSRDQILANVANGSLVTPGSVRGDLPRPLEAIICKAMSRSPDSRYSTAEEFAEDLRRFAAGESVQAKMPGWSERSLRWGRRNPLVTLATLIGAISLVMTVLGMQAMHSEQLTRVNKKLAESNDELIETNLELESREAQLREQLYVSDMSLAFQAYNGHNLKATKELLDQHRPKPEEAGSSRFAFEILDYLVTPPPSKLLTQHHSPATEVAVSRDGQFAISVSKDGEVHVIDLQSEKLTHRYQLSGRLDAIAICPDNKHFLTGLNGDVGFNSITLREIATGTETLGLLGHWHNIESAAFSSDGTLFATAGRYRDVQVHRLDGTAVKTVHGGSRNESLQFAGDGHTLAYVKEVGKQRLLHAIDLDTDQETRIPIEGETLQFSIVQPAGDPYRTVAFGNKYIKVADSTNESHFAQAFALNAPVRCVAISADGEDMFAGTDDGLVYAWTLINRTESGDFQPPMIFQAAEGQISSIQVIPANDNSARIVTTGEDGQVRLWDLTDKLPVRPNPVGRTFVTAHIINSYSHHERPFDVFLRLDDNSVWHYDPRRDLNRMLPIKCDLEEWGFQFGCDSRASKIAIANSDEVEVRDVASSELLARIIPPYETESISDVKFVEGKLCVLLSKQLLVYDAVDYSLVETHDLPSDNNSLLLNVPGSDALMIKASNMLCTYENSIVSVFEASSTAAVRYVRVDFDATASRIAVVFDNRLVEVRSYPQNETIAVLRGYSKPIADTIFLDRGRTLATTGEEGLIRFWDLSSEREMGMLPTGRHLENDLHLLGDTDLLMVTSRQSPAELLLTKQSRARLAEQRRAIGLD